VIEKNVLRLDTDFSLYKEARQSDIARLSTRDLTQARLLRNEIAIQLGNDQWKVVYDGFDEFIKRSVGMSRATIVDEFLKQPVFRNNIYFLDSGNKKWNPASYANMYARTRSREVEDEIMSIEMKEDGLDVVQINDVSTTTPICLQYENKYFSLTGATPQLPILDILPPFHPNCRHRKFPVENYKSSMLSNNKSIDNKVKSISKKWSKAEKSSIRKQESWNRENRKLI
jgi:hypothetical protein